ncbi:MAG: L-idonate 5-dehydrogenase [Pseudomonadota bacterium]
MKALVAHGPKDIRVEDAPDPDAQGRVLVRMERGGICGSDLHYYSHGGFGSVRLREPMILGHEVAGRVISGPGFAGGERVAISPSRPCGRCDFCEAGQENHCPDMRFYGSAMPFPHIQGAFREILAADPSQCIRADGLSAEETAMAEPLAVVLHAAKQAGNLSGRRVLVSGCGPIGLLAVLVASAAGAQEIVATDLAPLPLKMAAMLGAEAVEAGDGALDRFHAVKGHFDVHFECSGAAVALASAIPALKPRATIVQLGLGGDMTLPLQAMTAKEIVLKGSFRFHAEFAEAVAMMQARHIDVRPLITHVMPLAEAVTAFETAADRTEAIKVQLAF